MKKSIATLLVLVHFAVLMVHGNAHSQLHIAVGAWQKAFIAIIIFVAPLMATIMLSMHTRRLSFVLLGLSLVGSLVFGVSYHFLIQGPDNALRQYHSHWGTAFRATAVLLALIEAAGVALCIFVLLAKPAGVATSDTDFRSRQRGYENDSILQMDSEHRRCL